MLILFDLDSTLVTIEGLDFLAKEKGLQENVQEITRLTMEGDIPFKEAFAKKIDIIAPSKADMELLAQKYKEVIVRDASEVIQAFHMLGHEVGIVTGNFSPAVIPLAKKMRLSEGYIFTNDIFFNKDGSYSHINQQNPLAGNRGKRKIVENIGRKDIIFIGDSATDLEVKDKVKLFIGFGGVVERKRVREEAEIFLNSRSMLPLIDLLLKDEEKKDLIQNGHDLLVKNAKSLAQQYTFYS